MYSIHQNKDIQQIKKILKEEFENFCDCCWQQIEYSFW